MQQSRPYRPRFSYLTLAGVISAHVGVLLVLARPPVPMLAPVAPALLATVQVELIHPQASALLTARPEPVVRKPAPLAAPPRAAQAQAIEAAKVATAAPRTVLPTPGGEVSASPVTQPENSAGSAGATEAAQGQVSEAKSTSAPRFDADYLDNPQPAYPALSRRVREEGKVTLKVYVESSGLPSKVEVRTPSPYQRLDQAAVAAVSRWKFVPARLGSQPVGAWVTVPIVFSLKG